MCGDDVGPPSINTNSNTYQTIGFNSIFTENEDDVIEDDTDRKVDTAKLLEEIASYANPEDISTV